MPVCPVARNSASTPPAAQRPSQRQGGVFLAQRAVGSDGQQSPAGALATRSDRDVRGRDAKVDQTRAAARRRRDEGGKGGEAHVHPAHQVQPRLGRLRQCRHPVIGYEAATVADRHDHRPGARPRGGGGIHSGQAEIERPVAQHPLGQTLVPRPVAQAERRLGVAGLGHVAGEQQIGGVERDRSGRRHRRQACCSCGAIARCRHPLLLFDCRGIDDLVRSF